MYDKTEVFIPHMSQKNRKLGGKLFSPPYDAGEEDKSCFFPRGGVLKPFPPSPTRVGLGS
jgi:hypothetical protein